MAWDIRYSCDGEDFIESHPTAETAIEAACALIDRDFEVHGIWTGVQTETIGLEQLLREYNFRSGPGVPATNDLQRGSAQ
jgi:hypothetical protein